MRKYRYMMPQFTFYDRTGIQRQLEAKAGQGWLLDKVSPMGWRFRRIEPKNIHFAVTYFPAASQFDPGPGDAQKELFDFCAHSGWVLAGTTAQLQIFYNEQEDPVPIETDPEIELENIHRSAKKNFLPSYGLLFVLAIFQLALQLGQIMDFPLQYLSSETTFFSLLCQLVLLIMTGQELVGYFRWYWKAKPAAENGEFVETKGHRTFQLGMMWCLLAALALLVVELSPSYGVTMLMTLGLFMVLYGVIFWVTGFMKRMGVSTNTNRTVTFLLAVVLSVALTATVSGLLIRVIRSPVWEENRIVGTTEVHGMTFEIYGDHIPLKVEDLMEASSPEYSYEAHIQRSPILRREEYSQRIWGPSDLPDLDYVIYSTWLPAVYDLCVEDTLHGKLGGGYREIDPAPWGAAQAWQRFTEDGFVTRRFLLCFDNKVVLLVPDWDLTQEQMARAGQILGE